MKNDYKRVVLDKIFKENKTFILLNKEIFEFLNKKGILDNNKYFIIDNYEEYKDLKEKYKKSNFYYISNNNLDDLNNFLVLLKLLSDYYNLEDLKKQVLILSDFDFKNMDIENIKIKKTEEMENLISNLLLLNTVLEVNSDKEKVIEIELKNLETTNDEELLKYSRIIFLLTEPEELENNLYYILLLKDLKKDLEIKFQKLDIEKSREEILNLFLLLSNLKVNINIENLEEDKQKYLLDLIAEEDLYLKGLKYNVEYIPKKYAGQIFVIR